MKSGSSGKPAEPPDGQVRATVRHSTSFAEAPPRWTDRRQQAAKRAAAQPIARIAHRAAARFCPAAAAWARPVSAVSPAAPALRSITGRWCGAVRCQKPLAAAQIARKGALRPRTTRRLRVAMGGHVHEWH
jgi:hypothetical protein